MKTHTANFLGKPTATSIWMGFAAAVLLAVTAQAQVVLQEWNFNQPDGTGMANLTNSVPGGATWATNVDNISVMNNKLRAVDAEGNVSVSTTNFSNLTTGRYELSWTFDAQLSDDTGGSTVWRFAVRDNAGDKNLFQVGLQWNGIGELRLHVTRDGVQRDFEPFESQTLSNTQMRVLFDLDTDKYDVFVNGVLVAHDLEMLNGQINALTIAGGMHLINRDETGNYIDVDNLKLSTVPFVPSVVTTVLDLKRFSLGTGNTDPTAGFLLQEPGGAPYGGQGYCQFDDVTLYAHSLGTNGEYLTSTSPSGGLVYSDYNRGLNVFREYPPKDWRTTDGAGWDEIQAVYKEVIALSNTYPASVRSLKLVGVRFLNVMNQANDRAFVVFTSGAMKTTNMVENNFWSPNVYLKSGDTIRFSPEGPDGAFSLLSVVFETAHGVAPQPTLSAVLNGANVDISWLSAGGCDYQLQTRSLLTDGWANLGSPVTGDGTTKTVSVPANTSKRFFRMVVQ